MSRWLEIGLSPLLILGRRSRAAVRYLAVLSVFVYLPARRTLLPPYNGTASILKTTVMQVYFTGVQALPLFGFLSLVFGLSLSITLTTAVGIKALLCTIIIRGVAPILGALIILGRSGTAITVELGNMTVLGEIRQLRRMGIDPFRHVIFPRLVGVTAATFFLGIFFSGGIVLVTALFSTEPTLEFLEEILNNWSPLDVIILTEKEILSGLIIAMVACYQGLNLQPLTTEVPKATIRTVIHCIILCVAVDFLFTAISVGYG
jgi:phospholipid/cholesterol/gamma-HCH transport system permease protein